MLTFLHVYRGSTVSPQPLLDEVDSLRIELTDTLVEMADRQEEISTLKEAMAKMAMDRAAVMNHGKTVEESSERHRRRKLSHFHSVTEAALWFAESFGLIPDQLSTHTATSGERITIQFGEGNSQGSPQPVTTRIPDEFCAMQTLYLLDRFGVSDEFYHELTQVNSLPRQHIKVSFCYRTVAWVTGYSLSLPDWWSCIHWCSMCKTTTLHGWM